MRPNPAFYFLDKGLLFFKMLIGKRRVEGAQVIIMRGDEVLLIRPTYRPHWEFPGGAIDVGETAEEAAVREAHEEANIVISKIDRKLGTYLDRWHIMSLTIHVFIAGEWREEGEWRSGYEISARAFFPIHMLPADVSPAVRKRLRELALSEHMPDEFSGTWG